MNEKAADGQGAPASGEGLPVLAKLREALNFSSPARVSLSCAADEGKKEEQDTPIALDHALEVCANRSSSREWHQPKNSVINSSTLSVATSFCTLTKARAKEDTRYTWDVRGRRIHLEEKSSSLIAGMYLLVCGSSG